MTKSRDRSRTRSVPRPYRWDATHNRYVFTDDGSPVTFVLSEPDIRVVHGGRWWLHNVIAHPLLALCPPLGRWLHDRTVP